MYLSVRKVHANFAQNPLVEYGNMGKILESRLRCVKGGVMKDVIRYSARICDYVKVSCL